MRTVNSSTPSLNPDPQSSAPRLTFPCTVFVKCDGKITRRRLYGETSKSWVSGWSPRIDATWPVYPEKLAKAKYRILDKEASERLDWTWANHQNIVSLFNVKAVARELTYEQLRQIAAIIGYEDKVTP